MEGRALGGEKLLTQPKKGVPSSWGEDGGAAARMLTRSGFALSPTDSSSSSSSSSLDRFPSLFSQPRRLPLSLSPSFNHAYHSHFSSPPSPPPAPSLLQLSHSLGPHALSTVKAARYQQRRTHAHAGLLLTASLCPLFSLLPSSFLP